VQHVGQTHGYDDGRGHGDVHVHIHVYASTFTAIDMARLTDAAELAWRSRSKFIDYDGMTLDLVSGNA
jgi:hypothetical protein